LGDQCIPDMSFEAFGQEKAARKPCANPKSVAKLQSL